jgi:hypothetical protein
MGARREVANQAFSPSSIFVKKSKLRSEGDIPNINIKFKVFKKYSFYFEYCMMTSKNNRKFVNKCVCPPSERILVASTLCAYVKNDPMLFNNPTI